MKKNLLVCILIALFTEASAQRFDWATNGGYAGVANSYLGAVDIAVDPDGNVYTLDFANGSQICQEQTFENFDSYTTFVYKFNSDGELLLVNRIGAVSGDFYPFSIECDDDGSVYVLGQPNGVQELNINNNIVAAVGNTNQLIKFNSAGVFLWKIDTGYASNGEGCMLQYANGFLYYQSGSLAVSKISIDGIIAPSALTVDYYSTTVASSGPVFKGSGVFSNGDLLFAAFAWGTVAFGTDTLFHTGNPALTGPYLFVRCDEDMNVIWARFASNGRDPDRNFIPVAIDNDDNLYACVQVNSQMTIGTDVITDPEGNSLGIGSIIKFNSNGEGQWGHPLDETENAFGWCIERSGDGESILVGGGYAFGANFGDFTLEGAGNNRPFIAKLNPDGTYTNVFSYLDAPLQTDALSLKHTTEGRYFVGGRCYTSADPVFSCVPMDGVAGFYLGKFSEQPDIVPNPTITQDGDVLIASPDFEGEIQWFLNGAEIPGANEQTLTPTQSGNYEVMYEYTSGCVGTDSSTVVVVEIIGVDELKQSGVHIFPNPSAGLITLGSTKSISGTIHLNILNARGELVYSKPNAVLGQLIDISNLAEGIYMINILIPEGSSESHRLMKN